MSHQDWNTIVLKKPTIKKEHVHYEKTKETKIMEDDENLSHDRVSQNLGKDIQNARIAKGYKTQKEFAQALNVKPDIVNSYESGKAIPDNNILQKMRRLLKVKLDVNK